MAELRFLKGQKGKLHLIFEGYQFQVDKKTDTKTYYRCVVSQSTIPCLGRLHLTDGNVVFYNNNQNHAPNIARIDAKEKMEEIKEKAKNSCDTPSQLLTSLDVSFVCVKKILIFTFTLHLKFLDVSKLISHN